MENAQLAFAQCNSESRLKNNEAVGYILNDDLKAFEDGTLNANVKFYDPNDITKYTIVKSSYIVTIKTVTNNEMEQELTHLYLMD